MAHWIGPRQHNLSHFEDEVYEAYWSEIALEQLQHMSRGSEEY